MSPRLRSISLPDFGLPEAPPEIPAATYEHRCDAAYAAAGCDWLAVYGDREHFANMMFLTGIEPRFEEMLLLLGPGGRRVLVVGNECIDYAPLAILPSLDIVLAQSFGLMGQDRTVAPQLPAVLAAAGLGRGQTVGVAGWKYLEAEEWPEPARPIFVPAVVADAVAIAVGGRDGVSDATPVLMHPAAGLRSVVDVDQIAAYEWAASHASAMVWRILAGARPGDSEFAAAARMGYAGQPLSCHVMMSGGDAGAPVIGLRSPSARPLASGDGVTAAVGLWGGLSARSGLLAEHDDAFLDVAAGYFRGLLAWYAAADIGVRGSAVFEATADALARAGLRSSLNPGHLTGHDEWTHTPIRPGSSEAIASGMPVQVDVIPVPMRPGWALNCEDSVVFADAALRSELAARHPAVAARIEARRSFIRETLGIELKPSVLPTSNIALALPPFWLKPEAVLVAG
jgi:hypothetical protein